MSGSKFPCIISIDHNAFGYGNYRKTLPRTVILSSPSGRSDSILANRNLSWSTYTTDAVQSHSVFGTNRTLVYRPLRVMSSEHEYFVSILCAKTNFFFFSYFNLRLFNENKKKKTETTLENCIRNEKKNYVNFFIYYDDYVMSFFLFFWKFSPSTGWSSFSWFASVKVKATINIISRVFSTRTRWKMFFFSSTPTPVGYGRHEQPFDQVT